MAQHLPSRADRAYGSRHFPLERNKARISGLGKESIRPYRKDRSEFYTGNDISTPQRIDFSAHSPQDGLVSNAISADS